MYTVRATFEAVLEVASGDSFEVKFFSSRLGHLKDLTWYISLEGRGMNWLCQPGQRVAGFDLILFPSKYLKFLFKSVLKAPFGLSDPHFLNAIGHFIQGFRIYVNGATWMLGCPFCIVWAFFHGWIDVSPEIFILISFKCHERVVRGEDLWV